MVLPFTIDSFADLLRQQRPEQQKAKCLLQSTPSCRASVTDINGIEHMACVGTNALFGRGDLRRSGDENRKRRSDA